MQFLVDVRTTNRDPVQIRSIVERELRHQFLEVEVVRVAQPDASFDATETLPFIDWKAEVGSPSNGNGMH